MTTCNHKPPYSQEVDGKLVETVSCPKCYDPEHYGLLRVVKVGPTCAEHLRFTAQDAEEWRYCRTWGGDGRRYWHRCNENWTPVEPLHEGLLISIEGRKPIKILNDQGEEASQ